MKRNKADLKGYYNLRPISQWISKDWNGLKSEPMETGKKQSKHVTYCEYDNCKRLIKRGKYCIEHKKTKNDYNHSFANPLWKR